jgi:hypothetical protein
MPSGRVSLHPRGRNAGVGRSHSSGDGDDDGVIDCNLRARNTCSRSALSRAAARSIEDTPPSGEYCTCTEHPAPLLITTEEGFC